MTRPTNEIRREAALLMLVTLATGAAFWIGEGPEGALAPFLILLGFTALVLLGRSRSDALRTLGGVGDERTRSLYERSIAVAGTVVSVAVPAWWLVTVAQGRPNDTLGVVAMIFGVSFVGAAVVLSRRG